MSSDSPISLHFVPFLFLKNLMSKNGNIDKSDFKFQVLKSNLNSECQNLDLKCSL